MAHVLTNMGDVSPVPSLQLQILFQFLCAGGWSSAPQKSVVVAVVEERRRKLFFLKSRIVCVCTKIEISRHKDKDGEGHQGVPNPVHWTPDMNIVSFLGCLGL